MRLELRKVASSPGDLALHSLAGLVTSVVALFSLNTSRVISVTTDTLLSEDAEKVVNEQSAQSDPACV
jgi:hypothetical protein